MCMVQVKHTMAMCSKILHDVAIIESWLNIGAWLNISAIHSASPAASEMTEHHTCTCRGHSQAVLWKATTIGIREPGDTATPRLLCVALQERVCEPSLHGFYSNLRLA